MFQRPVRTVDIGSCEQISHNHPVLLITSPSTTFWHKAVQIALGHSSLVGVDPFHRDAQWLRYYAEKLLRKPDICQPFPLEDFDWQEAFSGERQPKFTFADIDEHSRNAEARKDQSPAAKCVGWLSAVIVEMNISTL